MKKALLWLCLLTFVGASECKFKNASYNEVCKKALAKGVDLEYIESFLTSPKAKEVDELSFKLFQPSQIATHKKNEKKANNSLVQFIPEIVEHLQTHKKAYDYAEREFGVSREIIAAILMKETRLGRVVPKHDSFVVFNTLLLRTKPDSDRNKWLLSMSKSNMVAILHHCYTNNLSAEACNLPSSYAGAIGVCQFMPDNLPLTRSMSGNAPDISKSDDAIISAANFLKERAKFDSLIEWDKLGDIAEVESQWYEYEFSTTSASFVHASGKNGVKYNCFTCGKSELSYLRDLTQKVMRYNNSSTYAIGVLRLAYEANRLLKDE